MASGVPVIATGWGGNMDYVDANVAYLIDFELREVVPAATEEWSLFTSDMLWANPSVDDLKRQMRRVFEDRDAARAVGLTGMQHVRQKFSGQAVASIADRLLSGMV